MVFESMVYLSGVVRHMYVLLFFLTPFDQCMISAMCTHISFLQLFFDTIRPPPSNDVNGRSFATFGMEANGKYNGGMG